MDEAVSRDPKVRPHLWMKADGMQGGRDGSASPAPTNLPQRGSRP